MKYYYKFNSPAVFTVSGKDAYRYLQSRLSNDISTVNNGRAVVAAQLDHKGIVEGIFVVLLKGDSYLLYSANNTPNLLENFTRYIVADRVEVKDISERFTLVHLVGSANDKGVPKYTVEYEGQLKGWKVWIQRVDQIGIDILSENALPALDAREIDTKEWNIKRIKSGYPSYPDDFLENSLITEYNLDDAWSINKGCYVGQEVVQKIASVGRTPNKVISIVIDNASDLNLTKGGTYQYKGYPCKIVNYEYSSDGKTAFCLIRVPSRVLDTSEQTTV